MKTISASLAALCLWAAFAPASTAQSAAADPLAQFDRKAALTKELGGTHLNITEGLPASDWERDPKDPYPAWFVHHASLLKIYPPQAVAPFINAAYVAETQRAVSQRCAVLRKYGLKATWNANEPSVMPEAMFVAHPEWRGPRIDHPARSTKEHFAINVDEPETLALYSQSIQMLLKACPEAEIFNWVTTDAGSGFDWSPGLYPGANGQFKWQNRPMADRVVGFLTTIQKAAKAAGYDIRININPIAPRQWMIPTFSPDTVQNIVRQLPPGLAVEGKEGPDGKAFGGRGGGGGGGFPPIVGLVVPSLGGTSNPTTPDAAGRAIFNLGDPLTIDFNYRLLKATKGVPMRTITQRVNALRAFAVTEVGEDQADNLIEMWDALGDVSQNLNTLDFGGMLQFGHVLNRWITRPMVPFPLKLTDEEKKDYRPFLFQAKGEEQASNLIDIQAMRMYEGWGAKLLFQRTIEITVPRAERALRLAEGIRNSAKDAAARKQWDMTAKRIQALIYLLQSADNMVDYQAQLDRVNEIKPKIEPNAVLGVQSSWDRTDLMETARREIDIMVALEKLLASSDEPILALAPTPALESQRLLGPNVRAQIRHKIETMNKHWRDYDQLFTIPNP